MEWNNHGNYLRPVPPPFVSRPVLDNSMGFLYNCNYDHYPGTLEMMKYPAVMGQGSHAMGSGSMNNIIRHDHHQMAVDGKKKRLSSEQLESLECSFQEEVKLDPERKMKLARELGLQPRQVAIWFQNRRARWKAKQLEHEFEVVCNQKKLLKHQFDAVSKENKLLQDEVSKLNAMLKEVQAGMRNHHQVVSTEISGEEDTGESTSVGNRSSLLLTRQHHHHHHQNIAPSEDHHVNNYHAFNIADDYNSVPPPPYWNNVMPPSYP